MPNAAPDAKAVARFREGLDRAARSTWTDNHSLTAEARFGLAVSGGADSLALLLLAQLCFPGRIEAATFDHGFRPASAAEAAHVGDVCAAIGVPHTILLARSKLSPEDRAQTERRERGGLQALARAWRYRELERWCRSIGARWLLTGHHADDQAETVLMRLARGSGARGLSGIRPALTASAAYLEGDPPRDMPIGETMIGRPLLGFDKRELAALVEAAGLHAVVDPSNVDPRFDRTRARALLAGHDWLEARRLSQVASHMRDAADAIEWAAELACETAVTRDADDETFFLDPAGLPDAILRELCATVIEWTDGYASGGTCEGRFTGPELTRFIARLKRGQTATLCHTLARGGERWHFSPAPPRREKPPLRPSVSLRISTSRRAS